MSEEQQQPKTHKELRTVLDGIRTGKAVGDDGKVCKRPELEVNRKV